MFNDYDEHTSLFEIFGQKAIPINVAMGLCSASANNGWVEISTYENGKVSVTGLWQSYRCVLEVYPSREIREVIIDATNSTARTTVFDQEKNQVIRQTQKWSNDRAECTGAPTDIALSSNPKDIEAAGLIALTKRVGDALGTAIGEQPELEKVLKALNAAATKTDQSLHQSHDQISEALYRVEFDTRYKEFRNRLKVNPPESLHP